MMELEYSPRHSAGCALHLLSPTHTHTRAPGATVDGFPSIGQIRQSLSRSPSKPARYQLYTSHSASTSPTVSMTPFGLPRAPGAEPATEPVHRSKFAVKRNAPMRGTSRRTSPPIPLRRALSTNANYANTGPRFIRRSSTGEDDQENMDCDADGSKPASELRFDEPIKIDFLKPDKLLQPVKNDHASPMKSSPLKRSDGVMNLEAATFGSPRYKRRSLHGPSMTGDFNLPDLGLDGMQSDSADSSEEKDQSTGGASLSTGAAPAASSPQRRPFSLRKSTLQQRAAPGRSRLFPDAMRDPATSPITRARSRVSLDSALPIRTFDVDSPIRSSNAHDPPVLFAPPAQRLYQSAPKPHPLSHALTPSSSTSSLTDEQSRSSYVPAAPTFVKPDVPNAPSSFSKSLPVGCIRPSQSSETDSSQASQAESFATPAGYKMARPLPQAFMSTGLISKRNRNMDVPPAAFTGSVNMPDTPSKKAHIILSPSPGLSALGKVSHPLHEFGSPSTPFNGRNSKISPGSLGRGVSIFGSRVGAPQLTRRSSFLSIDGEDPSKSPSSRQESQSSADELPPTPTKSTSMATRPQSKEKSNSLRSSLFGRRTSLGLDTFTAPASEERPPLADNETSKPDTTPESANKRSPHTPQESYTPPDPSSLSISAVENRPTTSFGSSNASSFPPATPTGPRGEHPFHATLGHGHASSSYFANEVDTALTSRFGQVTTLGFGEFSHVYRVEKPLREVYSAYSQKSASAGSVWAVKKSRKPYTGNKDRQRKMREVHILKALRGQEHLVELVNDWEAKNHLYIITEFYENGNLRDFLLQTGYKGRLDDFRIWKVLLELSQGVKSIHDASFIHLDLKPANVFIDWEGVLKIGDFGMASPWPAPQGLDGEGDREYIGPEVLSGRFDKPADIFSLGMIMLEIAGNIVLPDNGTSWQRLRAGDMSDLPSLTWSSDSNLPRDESGDPIQQSDDSAENLLSRSHSVDDDLSFLQPPVPKVTRIHDLVEAPNFMVDPKDPEALDRVVQWMIHPHPDQRPVVDQLLAAGGVRWVERRRRAGATVFEGSWGPADDVLNDEQDVEMLDF